MIPLVQLVEDDTANYLRTTATIWSDEAATCVVAVRILPGMSHWECPHARDLRRLARRAAVKAGRALAPRARFAHTDGPVTEWRFTYWLQPKGA